jgi:hypothetical protein
VRYLCSSTDSRPDDLCVQLHGFQGVVPSQLQRTALLIYEEYGYMKSND